MKTKLRIGIDLGGSKIAAIGLNDNSQFSDELRITTPRNDYQQTLAAIASLVKELEHKYDAKAHIGLGIPGSISPITGKVQNANSTWLNGKKLHEDLEQRLNRPVRLANDANCFALSEATDGAGQTANVVLGLILGTGCGAGIVVNGKILQGRNNIGGEWGHNPLPWPQDDEWPGPQCWCGRNSCTELWLSGTGISRDHHHHNNVDLTAAEIAQKAEQNDPACRATLNRHQQRLARSLAALVNIIDPDIIVIGGGLSHLEHLYSQLPAMVQNIIFADAGRITISQPVYGDASGVRGAARLWHHDDGSIDGQPR